MFTENEIKAVENIVGGKVYSMFRDSTNTMYDVGFEKDGRLQQKEVPKKLVDDEVERMTEFEEMSRKDNLGGKT